MYISGLKLSESNEVTVKYGFKLELKKLFLLKIHITIYKKQTNKQTKKKIKENKPMLGLT